LPIHRVIIEADGIVRRARRGRQSKAFRCRVAVPDRSPPAATTLLSWRAGRAVGVAAVDRAGPGGGGAGRGHYRRIARSVRCASCIPPSTPWVCAMLGWSRTVEAVAYAERQTPHAQEETIGRIGEAGRVNRTRPLSDPAPPRQRDPRHGRPRAAEYDVKALVESSPFIGS
jgi:hypothetical protein